MKRITIGLGLVLSLIVAAGTWGLVSSAAAATETITVVSTGDATNSASDCPGTSCTLRDALDLAANDGPGDTIDLPAGPITLTEGQLNVTLPVTIQGYSATQPTEIEQTTSDSRVIDLVIGGAGDTGGQYNLDDLELTGGDLTDAQAGAGVYAFDTGTPAAAINFTDDLIADNTVAPAVSTKNPSPVYGGGLYLSGDDTFTVSDTRVADNMVTGASAEANTTSGIGAAGGEADGAGIYYVSSGSGQLVLNDGSRVDNNAGTGGVGAAAASGSGGPGTGGAAYGGGIYAAGPTTLTDSQIDDNAVNGGSGGTGSSGNHAADNAAGGEVGGGGIDADAHVNLAGADTVDANTATVNDNSDDTPDVLGAGLDIESPSTITASSVYANVASGGEHGVGGIYVNGPGSTLMLTLTNTTVATNETKSAGRDAYGGLWLYGVTDASFDTIAQNEGFSEANVFASARADGVFADSIIAQASGGGANCTALTDAGANLEDDAADSCGFSTGDGSLVGANADLGSLAVNDADGEEHVASSTDIETLLPGTASAALGLVPSCAGTVTDGRDLPRPDSGACDAGAVQVELARNAYVPDLSPGSGTDYASPGGYYTGGSLICSVGGWNTGDSSSISSYVVEFLSGATVVNTQSVPPSSTNDPVASYTTTAAEANSQISCEVAAVTAYGQSPFVTASGPVSLVLNPATGGSGSTTAKPRLSDLTETHKTWRPAKLKTTAKTRHDPVGTTFHYDASQTGTVTLTLLVQTRGVKHGHSCVAGKAKRKQRTCLRWVRYATVGSYPVTLPGPQMISFNGRLHGHALATGAYEAQVTEVASGGASDLLTIAFIVVH